MQIIIVVFNRNDSLVRPEGSPLSSLNRLQSNRLTDYLFVVSTQSD